MKNLIKVQSMIMDLEEFRELGKEYRSTFNYENETFMVVTTYCKEWTITLSMMFDNIPNLVCYLESNDQLRFLDYEREV